MAILDNSDAPLQEKDVSIWGNVKKWAIISALVGVVFQLIQQVTGVMNQGGMVIALYSVVSIGIGVAIYVMALREHREQELGGFMSFKRAFFLAFMIGIVSATVVLIFNYLYMNFINPNAMEAQLEMTKSMMEKFGMPEDQLDAAIEKQRANLASPLSIVTGLLSMAVFTAIISLIMGAIMKKERPTFQ